MKFVVIIAIVVTIGIMLVSLGTSEVFAEESIEVPFILEIRENDWTTGGIGTGNSVILIVTGDLQDKGVTKITISGLFERFSSPLIWEKQIELTPDNIENWIDIDWEYKPGNEYTLIATNGNYSTSITWIPIPSSTASDVDDFRVLPGEEKEYTESMNILGKAIRIFDDKICVEEYCKKGNTIPVHLEGNIGINTKNPIKLQITYCDKNYYFICGDYIGLENMIIAELPAKNMGGGNFYADWTFKKTASEGVYQIVSVVDGNVIGEVGDSMSDIINGQYNDLVIVVSNLTPLQTTPITDKNATIFVEIEYGQTDGTVHYEICAKDNLTNPSFEISSDSDRNTIVNEIELKSGECFEGEHTILAKAPATILVPLGTEKSTSSEELDGLKSEIAELRKMLEEEQSVLVEENPPEKVVETNSITSESEEMQSEIITSEEKGGGCLIATATYGSELAPQVQLLREIRDNSLLQTVSGTSFMTGFNDFYYTFSPTIADWERESPIFKEVVKLAITPMISTLSLMENAESESEVLGIGISLIALNLGMYLGIPAIVIIGIRKKF